MIMQDQQGRVADITTLTKEQIDSLFAFCEKHLVRYYDVQMELVDHLANAIEEKMKTDKDISFDEALKKVYAGFGVMGFGQMVGIRAGALEKQYSKERWRLFREYFSWPKIGLTALLLALLLVSASWFSSPIRYYISFVVKCSAFLYHTVAFHRLYRLKKKQVRKLVMTDMVVEAPFFLIVFYYVLFFSRPSSMKIDTFSSLEYVLVNAWAIVYILIAFAYLRIGKKTFTDAKNLFPAAFAK